MLFAAEGCETKRVERLDENRYEIWSKVMTVFKNPETGEILNGKEYRNPFTGEMNQVEPNVIGSHMILEPDEQGRITERPAAGGGFRGAGPELGAQRRQAADGGLAGLSRGASHTAGRIRHDGS